MGNPEKKPPVNLNLEHHIYIDVDNQTLDYTTDIAPLTHRVDEDVPIGSATFAICLESCILDTRELAVTRRYDGLQLSARYLSREFGSGRDVNAEAEFLTRSTRKKFRFAIYRNRLSWR